MHLFNLTTPCSQCPFRKDLWAFLTKARVRELKHRLQIETFSCHKTLEKDPARKRQFNDREQHCAGAAIFLERLGTPSRALLIAETLELYDKSRLDDRLPSSALGQRWKMPKTIDVRG